MFKQNNMKKIFLPLFGFLFGLSTFNAFAQAAPEVDSRKIIDKGLDFFDNQKYKDAAEEFKKVSQNDTNYVLAALELANVYVTDSLDSLALPICERLLNIPSSFIPTILVLKATALDNLNRGDEAIAVYEDGMKRYPLNYTFTYELGLLKLRQKKYKEGYDWLIKSVKVNPYHAATHFQLGYLAVKQGKLIPAMLAWQFYLTIDNSSERAKTIVNALEKMAKNEYEFPEPILIEGLDGQDDFSEIETLVKSKVALSKKYKSETDLSFNITKQIQLILEKIEVVKDDKGFFMQFYAPLFADLYKNKLLETYSYFILSGLENKEVDSWIKKNSTKTIEFATWFNNYLGTTVCTYDEMLNGQIVKARHYYSTAYKIYGVGNRNDKQENIGYWNYYYSNGTKKSEGAYNATGKRIGNWKFYAETGVIETIENYTDGKIDGLFENYFTNGSILSKRYFSNNLMDGDQIYYYPTGAKKMSYQYKANIENGKQSKFHENEKLEYSIDVINGKLQGDLQILYMNGHLKEKSSFVDNNRHGKFMEYYNFPENVLKREVNYEKGQAVGIFKSYHPNGNLSETGEYNKSSEKTGLWKNFSDDNILISEETFNDGKLSGINRNYSSKGKLTEEYLYKNGILQEYKAFDKEGKIVYQNKKDGKNNYDATLYYPNGNKKREGRVTNGLLDGKWKNYNANGSLTSEENYVDGKTDGKLLFYYENGKLKSETDYVAGETSGYYKEYYKNGKLRKEGAYVSEKAAGEWKKFYPDGSIESILFYKDGESDNLQQYFAANGKLDNEEVIELNYLKKKSDYDSLGKLIQESVLNKGTGLLNIKYPDGKPYWTANYQNNLVQGLATVLFHSGKTLATKNYVDGELHGEVKFFYPSGKLLTEENYVGGDLHGKVISYYEDGGIKVSYDYYYGTENGKRTYYYPNKKPEVEYSYKNGQLDGKTINYDESGELVIVRNFEDGYLTSYQYNDKSGNLIAPIEIKNETGTVKSYYKSGIPSFEYTLKNGAIEGKKTVYFPNGKIYEETDFVCDEKDGKRKNYFPSGKLKTEENWKSDERNGASVTYYENGTIKSEEYYLNDKKMGTFKNYDEKGNLIKTYFYYNGDLLNES
jgi:antitoxin component YwqK of YwqJK toxin-antitoxin module